MVIKSRVTLSTTMSPSQRTARRVLKKYHTRALMMKVSILKQLLPCIAKKDNITQLDVILEAIRYIQELEKKAIAKFRYTRSFDLKTASSKLLFSSPTLWALKDWTLMTDSCWLLCLNIKFYSKKFRVPDEGPAILSSPIIFARESRKISVLWYIFIESLFYRETLK